MVCEHESNGQKVWLPYQYHGRLRGLKAHPYCSKCGLVKSISSDGPKPVWYYQNILAKLAKAYSLSRVQIRLIAKELDCLNDPYGFDKHRQQELFKNIVLKYTTISERMIENAL
jgi:hypothetical protein